MSVVGLGTDIVEIERFSNKSTLSRLARRVLTPFEFQCFSQHSAPERYLAKRFAAKEAAVKALGSGIGNSISWQHIEVRNNEKGKPEIIFFDAAQTLAEEIGADTALLTIADEKHYAVATVVLSTNVPAQ